MSDVNYNGQYNGGVRRPEAEMRDKTVKSKMYSFTMLARSNDEVDALVKELETQSQYILYYRMDMGCVGVVQLSRATHKHTLEREYEDFVWRRIKSDEMRSRIGWIHRNKLIHYEAGMFTRRCVIREREPDRINHRHFYDPETGRISMLDDEGINVPVELPNAEPYRMRKWDAELRKFIDDLDIDSVTESKTETK